jgi:hypothetical protein
MAEAHVVVGFGFRFGDFGFLRLTDYRLPTTLPGFEGAGQTYY